MFGGVDKCYVNIKDLEKVEYDSLPNMLTFGANFADKNFVWRCAATNETFVFDK